MHLSCYASFVGVHLNAFLRMCQNRNCFLLAFILSTTNALLKEVKPAVTLTQHKLSSSPGLTDGLKYSAPERLTLHTQAPFNEFRFLKHLVCVMSSFLQRFLDCKYQNQLILTELLLFDTRNKMFWAFWPIKSTKVMQLNIQCSCLMFQFK